MNLTPRLAAAADFVRCGSVVADIGTDHCLLPIYLVQRQICPKAIAADLHKGPLRRAQQAVESFGMQEKIRLYVSDGLQMVPPGSADDIVIAGMGGERIATLVLSCNWLQNPDIHLILQPMTGVHKLRERLCRNGFLIQQETLVREGQKLYVVMLASHTGNPEEKSLACYYAGNALKEDSPLAPLYLSRLLLQLYKKISGMQRGGFPAAQIRPLQEAAGIISARLDFIKKQQSEDHT